MQERAKQTREKIFQAAVKIFSDKGFHGTRVDEVAEHAGVNKQRIYAYYGNKAKLFELCLKKVFEDVALFSGKSLAAAKGAPEQLTEMLLANFMSIHRKYPHFQRLLSWANLEEKIPVSLLKGIRGAENDFLLDVFLEAQAAGHLNPEISFETYLFSLMAVSYFYTSNKRTLSKSLSAALYTPAGRSKLNSELTALFRGQNANRSR